MTVNDAWCMIGWRWGGGWLRRSGVVTSPPPFFFPLSLPRHRSVGSKAYLSSSYSSASPHIYSHVACMYAWPWKDVPIVYYLLYWLWFWCEVRLKGRVTIHPPPLCIDPLIQMTGLRTTERTDCSWDKAVFPLPLWRCLMWLERERFYACWKGVGGWFGIALFVDWAGKSVLIITSFSQPTLGILRVWIDSSGLQISIDINKRPRYGCMHV